MTQPKPDPGRVTGVKQYAHVGPALFEIGLAGGEARLVKDRRGQPDKPLTAWLPINRIWLRLDGSWISGWSGDQYFAFRPSWWNRIKIRMAGRRWLATQEYPDA